MIMTILCCLALGAVSGYAVYYFLGMRGKSSDGPSNDAGKVGAGKHPKKKELEKKKTETEVVDQAYTDANDTRHTPRSEWYGGARH